MQVKMADLVIAEGTGRLQRDENTSENIEGPLAADMVLSLQPVDPQEWQG